MATAKTSESKVSDKSISKNSGKNSNAITKDIVLKAYKDMVLIRRFEERAGQLYGMGHIGGFCHLYIGQEAVVIGIQSALSPKDTIITSYRDHGHMLACDMDPKGVMAELTGRAAGYSRGKGGSMHMFSREKNFYGGHGIVGAQAPIGAGLAFGHKYSGDGGLCVAYIGDGAANQGQVYESYNMAALWKLPVLFVIENNKYSMGTALNRHAAGELYKRAEGYGIRALKIDGQDFVTVREAALDAVDYIRSGGGPMVLEVETYRYRGHSMSDPAKYRTKEEVTDYRDNQDPIKKISDYIVAHKFETEEALKAIDNDVKQIVVEAAEFAIETPEPDASELWTDVLK